MLTDLTFEDSLSRISDPRVIFRETLVPSACGKNPNSSYRPDYDWLFTYERILASVLEPWTAHLRFELIGEKGVLCEALSNAFCHGHKKDPAKPIDLSVFLGENGLRRMIQSPHFHIFFTDEGAGFNLMYLF